MPHRNSRDELPPHDDARPAAPSEGEAGAAVREAPAPPKVDRLPPFRVLLHDDDVNEMAYVADVIERLTPHNRTRAVELMLRAHTRGLAEIIVTHKERAELYRDQFRSKRLTVTIEPAE